MGGGRGTWERGCAGSAKKGDDLRGNRTPNLRVWNPTRCHCAMKSYLPMFAVTMHISHRQTVYGIADLAERLRRTLKARVRKSVGSIPTVCNNTYFFGLYVVGLLELRSFLAACRHLVIRPRIAQLAERETVDGYN